MSWPLFYCGYFWPTASVGEQHPLVGIVRNCKLLQRLKMSCEGSSSCYAEFESKPMDGMDVIIGSSANKKVEQKCLMLDFFSFYKLFVSGSEKSAVQQKWLKKKSVMKKWEIEYQFGSSKCVVLSVSVCAHPSCMHKYEVSFIWGFIMLFF